MLVAFLATLTALTAIRTAFHRSTNSDAALIETLQYEYDNGGLFQFFWNTRGEENENTLAALQRAGFGRHADLFGRVVAEFDAERETLAAAWKNPFDMDAYSSAAQRSAITACDIEWGKLPRLVPDDS